MTEGIIFHSDVLNPLFTYLSEEVSDVRKIYIK